jgi:hypothetical protein
MFTYFRLPPQASGLIDCPLYPVFAADAILFFCACSVQFQPICGIAPQPVECTPAVSPKIRRLHFAAQHKRPVSFLAPVTNA